MPEFIPPNDIHDKRFNNFTKGYLAAMFWVGIMGDEEMEGYTVENGAGKTVADIDEKSLDEILSDCRDFETANISTLEEFEDITGLDAEQWGHDFFLTRNGHGAGFWDRGAGEVGDKLSAAAKVYSSQGLYLGDDGKLYLHS